MSSCHEMRINQIYTCEDCGLELKVVKECKDVGKPADQCSCHGEEEEGCVISCCGHPLVNK